MDVLEQLKALLGNDWSTANIAAHLSAINALGIHVQNEARGDYRPRFLLPDGTTWDYGPGGWVGRGNIGDWHTGSTTGTNPPSDGTNPGTNPDGTTTTTQMDNGQNYPGGGNPPFYDQPTDIQTPSWYGGLPAQQSPTDYLRATPGYQFAFGEGQRAVQSSAAAKGTLLTGGTLKALAQYGTGVADQTYDAAARRFLSLASLGAGVGTASF
jgi:hypothetical protein